MSWVCVGFAKSCGFDESAYFFFSSFFFFLLNVCHCMEADELGWLG